MAYKPNPGLAAIRERIGRGIFVPADIHGLLGEVDALQAALADEQALESAEAALVAAPEAQPAPADTPAPQPAVADNATASQESK